MLNRTRRIAMLMSLVGVAAAAAAWGAFVAACSSRSKPADPSQQAPVRVAPAASAATTADTGADAGARVDDAKEDRNLGDRALGDASSDAGDAGREHDSKPDTGKSASKSPDASTHWPTRVDAGFLHLPAE